MKNIFLVTYQNHSENITYNIIVTITYIISQMDIQHLDGHPQGAEA